MAKETDRGLHNRRRGRLTVGFHQCGISLWGAHPLSMEAPLLLPNMLPTGTVLEATPNRKISHKHFILFVD